jgi:endonuclease/exonuclease/phosphatase family metal-dependent hydrolase
MSITIKIYNHNIRWSSSKKQHLEIVKKIEFLQPDIVCLQEVALEKQAKLFAIEGYNMYYNTIEKPRMAILTSLIKPFFYFYKNIENHYLYKVNKTKEQPNLKQRFKSLGKNLHLDNQKTEKNNKFLKGYLLVLVKKVPHKAIYKSYKEQGSIFGNMAERVTGKGLIKLEFEDYNIYNTHLLSSHKKKNVESGENNKNQFKELLSAAKGRKKTILIGDFNFGPESSKYSLTSNWFDLTKDVPITEYYWKTRLDYIFTNFEPVYSSCNIVQFENQPSDHYGIWCEMEF